MNESERQEIERLKIRQAELAERLLRLGREIEAFEARLANPGALKTEISRPAAIEPVQATAPAAARVRPPALPPIIPRPARPPSIARNQAPPAASVVSELPIQSAPEATPAPVIESTRAEQRQEEPTTSTTANSEPFVSEAPPSAAMPGKKSSFEMRLGTFWFAVVGIVVLLTGLGLAGFYAYQNIVPRLGPVEKVGLLYLAGGVLLGLGAWLGRKQEALRSYAQVLVSGGLAAVYFTTYAAHHVPNLRVISSPLLDGGLLFGWAGFIVWLADKKKSEALGLFAVLLSYYVSVITQVGLFTLYSNVLLTLVAVFFLVRNRWATLSFVSLVATYASYAFWRFYQDGTWHLVSPGEGLGTGNIFLVSYWIIFTVATFLSKHEQFAGTRRAAFLTLNNTAFFTAFLLTMYQTHTGGFWKFSLGYGTLLVTLAALAWKLRSEDRIFRNAYLSQGLLLVTLGIITKLSGMRLSLVLGVESVALVTIGKQMGSRVMRIASLLAAALAVFWGTTLLQPFQKTDLVSAGTVGGLMLFNAFCERDEKPFPDAKTGPRALFFTMLGLGIWLVATWQNTTSEWRGLILAAEGASFLLAARPLRNQTLEFAALGFGVLGVTWQGFAFAGQFNEVALASRIGLGQSVLTGALMLAAALWQRRISPPANEHTSAIRVTIFSCLGMVTWLGATLVFTPLDYLAPLLALEALTLTAAYYLLRLRETVTFGQVFLLVAQSVWVIGANAAQPTQYPWWNPVAVIGITLTLSQWWQRQRILELAVEVRTLIEGWYALAVVGVLFFWLQPNFSAPHWLAFTAGLALLLTVYGVVTRSWLVALAGQIFMAVSGGEFVRQLLMGEPEWWFPLAPMVALLTLAIGTVKWFQLRPTANRQISGPLLTLSQVYRVAAAAMFLAWIGKYIPEREQCWVLALAGLLLFFLAGWRRSLEILVFAGAYTLFCVGRFWIPGESTTTLYWPNLVALLLVPAQQYWAKRAPENFRLTPQIHGAAMVVGALSLWLLLTRWVEIRSEAFYLTASWAALALIIFLTGMGLRERVYRWLGLAVLACALGRVAVFDFWRLNGSSQILSCLALGVVFLLVSFLYTKYQDKFKEWL